MGGLTSCLTFFKLLQHCIQLGVIEHKMQRVAVKLCDGLERGAIIRIHKGQVLDEEQIHYVGPLALEDRDARVAALHNLGHGVKVQGGIPGDHEAISQRRHHVLHGLGPELQCALDDVQLLLHQVVIRVRDAQHLQKLLPVVHGSYLLSEQVVQKFAHRIRSREGEQHEELGEKYGVCTDSEAVSGTDGLRHDFSKNYYSNSGHHHRNQPRTGDIIQQDGQRGVYQHVPEQKRAKQVIPLAPDRLYFFGVILLPFRAAVLDYLELHGVQSHEPQVQPAEHTRQAEQHRDEDDLEPERQQKLFFLHHYHFGVIPIVVDPGVLRPRVVHPRHGRSGGGDAKVIRFTPLRLSQRFDLNFNYSGGLSIKDDVRQYNYIRSPNTAGMQAGRVLLALVVPRGAVKAPYGSTPLMFRESNFGPGLVVDVLPVHPQFHPRPLTHPQVALIHEGNVVRVLQSEPYDDGLLGPFLATCRGDTTASDS